MIELGQLEAHHEEFARRNVRIAVASVEGREDAAKTAADFPHLVVLADPEAKFVNGTALHHLGAGRHGEDIAAPTTILFDREGRVRWLFRPDRIIVRLSPAELLAAVDQRLAVR
jgi:hypothetical protein